MRRMSMLEECLSQAFAAARRAPVQSKFVVGLDLGQKQDPTALVVLECREVGGDVHFDARHIQRFPLGQSYPSMVQDIAAMLQKSPLAEGDTTLAVDETGVGTPVVDLFRQANLNAELRAIHITGGATVNKETHTTYVPKRELVGTVQVALQTGRLKIAQSLPEADALVRELQNFRVTLTEAANDTYGGRQGTHDDLVLALALALWIGNERAGVLEPVDFGLYDFRGR